MPYFRNFYTYNDLLPTDIYPVQYGEEECDPSHSFGPCVRSNYLIHYVYEGEGIFKTEKETFHLKPHQMFLIVPNQLTYYEADAQNPWLYRWIEFNGSMAEHILNSAKLSANNPIFFDDTEEVGNALKDIIQNGNMPFSQLMQKFWGLLHSISAYSPTPGNVPRYISLAENFIKINVHKKITVNDVSDHLGIDRSYLSRLFKEYCQVSPQEYILTLKMNTAAQYLKDTDITISEAAQSVGYSDIRVFYKAFKNQFNCSPSQWRKKQEEYKYIISTI